MRITPPDIPLQKDSRGVSEVVGFLLVFALLIILLSINQAQFVPQENSEVEFQHFEDVRDDMVDVRSAISNAGQNNVSQYPTVQLGTSYPTRLFAVNPPPPTGTLRTTQQYPVKIYEDPANDTPTEEISTRFLEYQNGYNELDIGSIWYENSVVYLDERDGGGNVAVIEDQNIVLDNSDSVRVTAIKKEYSEASTGRVTIEFYPVEDITTEVDGFGDEIKIGIPTRLNKEYWNDELAGYEGYDESGFNENEGGINSFNLTVDTDSLKFNTVGINSQPEDGQDSIRSNIASETEEQPSEKCTSNGDLTFNDVTKGDNAVLDFSVDNSNKETTITDFSVDATQIKSNARIDNGDSSEFKTNGATQEGEANRKDGDYDADGTKHSLDTEANISGGTEGVVIELQTFEPNGQFDDQEFVASSEEQADVTVTLYCGSASEYSFYFEDDS